MASGRRKGTGVAIIERKDGRFMAVVAYKDEAGRAKRTYVYGRNRDEVTSKVETIQERVRAGMPATDSKVTLDEYAARWITSTLEVSDRKATTKDLYARLTRYYIIDSDLGARPLGAIRPGSIESWVAWLRTAGKSGLSQSTVRQTYTVLRAILATAVRDDLIGRNPAEAITRPKIDPHEAEFLTPAQVRLLLENATGSRYAAMFELLVNTGLRRGEALALRCAGVMSISMGVRCGSRGRSAGPAASWS